MDKSGPIVIIEDDESDRFLIDSIFKKLNYDNQIVFFEDGNAALDYLNQTEVVPFLILSDIKMPKIDGMELRSRIHTNEMLHLKCIPYLFFATNANKQSVVDAYSLSVQGFFIKPNSDNRLEKIIRTIVDYWQECIAPCEYTN